MYDTGPFARLELIRTLRELRGLLGDADPAAVLKRPATAFDDRLARCREPLCVLKGQPLTVHAEEFAWTAAALRARLDR